LSDSTAAATDAVNVTGPPRIAQHLHAQGLDGVEIEPVVICKGAAGGHANTSDADRTLAVLSRGHDERSIPMTASNENPATPDQTEHGFAEGMRRRPPRRRLGRFSDGLARRLSRLRLGRFSRGMERRPEAPGQDAGGRFSEGMEHASPKR
jgi:hypothetical protein